MSAGAAPAIARFGAEAAALLAALHAACFAEAWSAAAIVRILEAPGAVALVAGAAPPAGFALARGAADEAELLTLAVLPAWRRRGLGRALVEAALAWAAARGATALFLEVGAGNAAALALYGGAGFATVGRRPAYYRRPSQASEDALVMRRTLADLGARA